MMVSPAGKYRSQYAQRLLEEVELEARLDRVEDPRMGGSVPPDKTGVEQLPLPAPRLSLLQGAAYRHSGSLGCLVAPREGLGAGSFPQGGRIQARLQRSRHLEHSFGSMKEISQGEISPSRSPGRHFGLQPAIRSGREASYRELEEQVARLQQQLDQIEDSKELYKNSTAQLAGFLSAFTSQLNLASGESEDPEEWGEEVARHRASLGGGGAVARRSRVVMGTQRRSSARCTLPRRQVPSGSSQQAGTSSSLMLEGDLSSLDEDGSWSSSGNARGSDGRKKKESLLKKVIRSVRSLVSGSTGSSRTGEEATSSGSKRATS